MNRKWIKFTIIATLVAFLFLCKGGSLSFVAHNMTMGGDGNMPSMPCCDVEAEASVQHDVGEVILPQKEIAQIAVLGLALSLLGALIATTLHKLSYFLSRKNRFGSLALWNYFTLLFRQGILHPKTF